MQESIKLREFYYTLISRLLVAEIDADTIGIIQEDESLKALFLHSLDAGYLDGEPQKTAEELASVFVELFLIKLVPYESFYTSEDQMVNSGTENPVDIFYRKYGFEVELSRARAVSSDHIGIEFEFMMNLVKSEKVALNDGNEEYANSIRDIQKEFIKTHLLPFALLFLPALTDASKNPFYADAAEIALEFLLSDYEELCKE